MSNDSSESLAKKMIGYELADGWRVIRENNSAKEPSGGMNSVSYIVESKDGKKGFLKALDYSIAMKHDQPFLMLQAMTSAFLHELNILDIAKQKKMDRIVKIITHGNLRADGYAYPVDYLIFELAEGEIRKYKEISQTLDYKWMLRTLHHVAVGLNQLHNQQIAHQDIKPSNILVFEKEGSKIADMGSSSIKGVAAKHDNLDVAGDRSYAPPELLYGYVHPEWNVRRFGADAYLLGSMVVFFFMNINMTTAIMYELNLDHQWGIWGGTFEDVLPYLREAFDKVMDKFGKSLHPLLREGLVPIVRELCDPDPEKRCNPRGISAVSVTYSLYRYISKFNEMARKAEFGVWRF